MTIERFLIFRYLTADQKRISSESFVGERNYVAKKEVRSIVITGYGTNCEMEMAHGCRLAGSEVVDIGHISELNPGRIT